jgi:hypothetical protein
MAGKVDQEARDESKSPAMSRRLVAWSIVLALAVAVSGAQANGNSAAWVVLRPVDNRIEGDWTVLLSDVDEWMRIPRVEVTTTETGRDRLVAYLAGHFGISEHGESCPIQIAPFSIRVDEKADRIYLHFTAKCAGIPDEIEVTYQLLFDVVRRHSGYLSLADGTNRAFIFSPLQRVARFRLARSSGWEHLSSSIENGIKHIWSGIDHMLFLLALLMTAVLERRDGAWVGRESLRAALVDVAKVVTGFTVTHSITLTLAGLGILRPPSRVIEPAIAASVVVAAIDNFRPFMSGRKWMIAFSLGLLHGFGFAGALDTLGLPRGNLVLTLFGFAAGVETGQFLVVAGFVPVAYLMRRTRFYRRGILFGGSLLIGVVATIWVVERIIGVRVIPI